MAAGPIPQAQPHDEGTTFVFLAEDIVQPALVGLLRYQASLREVQQLERPFHLERSPTTSEIEILERLIVWCRQRLEDLRGRDVLPIHLPWRVIRWLKAGILIEVEAMERAREEVFDREGALPRSLVEAINARISQIRNLAEQGFFNGLNPMQLTVDPRPRLRLAAEVGEPQVQEVVVQAPRMRVELLDPELRRRCGDLFEQFTTDPTHQDRFDTILREASTVLENRIRAHSGLPDGLYGMDLVSRALNAETGELILSEERQEQEGAHLLFRGYFGFVRNTVGHRLVPAYTQERAAQVLALVDYLLFLVSRSRRRNPPQGVAAPMP